MSDEFEKLVQVAANALVSAMAADSWEAAKRGFAALVGHEHQLESTHASLAAKSGHDLDKAKSEQARDWVFRLQDLLDSSPGMAPALQALIAKPGAPPEPVIRSQSQDAGGGSGNVNVGGSTGDIATGGSRIDKRKFRFSPLILLGHAAKQAVAHPAVAGITVLVVGAGAVSGGLAFTHHRAPHKVASSPAASSSPAPAHTVVPIQPSDSDASWPQLDGGPARTGYQPGETRIGPGNVARLAAVRTYQAGGAADGGVSAPLIAGGIIYVDKDTSRLYAFDATGAAGCSDIPTTCTPLWTAATAYFEGMTVANGKVFVTDQDGVQAFDAAGTMNCSGTPKTCAPLWTTSTNISTGPGFTPGSGSPVVANGVLYVPGHENATVPGQGGTSVAAFDAAGSTDCSGTPAMCDPMWTYGGPAGDGSPTIANGVLYIAEGSTLYTFDAAGSAGCSGTPKACAPLWTAAMSGPSYAVVAVADGIVYSTTESGLYAFDATGTRNCSTRTTAKTCAPLWTASVLDGGALAAANSVVYIASGSTLYAFDAAAPGNCPGTGATKTCSRAPLWTSADSTNVATGSLTVANGVVYISATDGGMDAYDAAGALNCSVSGTAKTCTPLWDHVTGFTTGGSPAIVKGTLFVNAPGNGDIYAFSL
jgi:predicted lipoprotein with Yx(FWY)xxD motif